MLIEWKGQIFNSRLKVTPLLNKYSVKLRQVNQNGDKKFVSIEGLGTAADSDPSARAQRVGVEIIAEREKHGSVRIFILRQRVSFGCGLE